ncbi:substrate-binding domain-containing protein [Marinomonas sp. M1K-6]|uniref:Substrate-binding domain-containing protein n=1 Tax=Marinomonas profundi TaxID=2726122 RepID=A0A847RAL3_9GAMM|nr:substrate-binding domain-containing protein [Marinomonas profundi]NLQ17280.1 substrate-binding domain-containing protein [Marinomonas profundi]UDV04531.1 substrate-binding domain-containing protein [Marinomonas profundi]
MGMLRSFVIWLVLGCSAFTLQAASMALDLMSSQDAYQSIPRLRALAEQFTTIVNSPPNPLRVAQKKPVRIALLLFGDAQSIDNKALLVSFKRRMRELGIDYRLDTYLDQRADEQDYEPYFKIEAAQPDYLVVTTFGSMQRRFLERFLRTGKTKVILYDFASPLTHWVNHPPLMYIGFDQQKATRMLASYLDRQLPPASRISALVLPDGYLGHVRCDVFLDEMVRYKRHVSRVLVVPDDKQQAYEAAQLLLADQPADFIFSCAQGISDGVIAALNERGESAIQTNAWGGAVKWVAGLQVKTVKVNMLFRKDDLSIAVAESIKLDLEGRNMPTLFMAHSALIPAELDAESLRLMMQQAHHYSVELWQ